MSRGRVALWVVMLLCFAALAVGMHLAADRLAGIQAEYDGPALREPEGPAAAPWDSVGVEPWRPRDADDRGRPADPGRLAAPPDGAAGGGDPASAGLPPGAAQRRALRERMAEAAALARAAAAGDAAAQSAVAQRSAAEPDPRVRAALRDGVAPDIGRLNRPPPPLPEPSAPVAAGEHRVYWLTPEREGTYESSISVGEDGRARIETVYETADGERWRVRYGAWAYRDAAGNTVFDARGEDVDVIERPPWGWWSPDSMVMAPNGTVEMIDDKHDPGSGTIGARAPG
jgi:hypothetical protein